MVMNDEVQTRAEFLGQLIKTARETAGLTTEDCASAIGLPTGQFATLENGERIASLPELEVLSMYLKVPMSHFFGSSDEETLSGVDYRSYLALRQMMIGTMLGQIRIQANLSVENLSEDTGIAVNQLLAYETGQYPIPYFDLETLAARLGASIKVFVDDEYGPLAENEAERELEKRFKEWDPKMKMFIADSRNLAYLETAMRLSEMDADRLRSIAEGILEITL
jgi:transcriptional regulator with XRE-family HTH domain